MIEYSQFYITLLEELNRLHGRLLDRNPVSGSRSYWKDHFYFKALRFAVMTFGREARRLNETLQSEREDETKLDSLVSHLLVYSFKDDPVFNEYLTDSVLVQIDRIRSEIDTAHKNCRTPSLTHF
jgi:hypothetical protein